MIVHKTVKIDAGVDLDNATALIFDFLRTYSNERTDPVAYPYGNAGGRPVVIYQTATMIVVRKGDTDHDQST